MRKERPISNFLSKIKKVVDSLSTFGPLISNKDHIAIILDNLNKAYSALITAIASRFEPYSIEEIEA